MSEQKLYVVQKKEPHSPYYTYLNVKNSHINWHGELRQATRFTKEGAECAAGFIEAVDKSATCTVEKVEPLYAIARDCANGVRVFFTGIWETDHHLEDTIQWENEFNSSTRTFDYNTAVKYQEALKTLCGLDTRLVF